MKQTLTRVFQLAVALLIGALAMTVYIQHRELTQMQRIDWSSGWETAKPLPTPKGSPTASVQVFPLFKDTDRYGMPIK
jgi:hypothetical protein